LCTLCDCVSCPRPPTIPAPPTSLGQQHHALRRPGKGAHRPSTSRAGFLRFWLSAGRGGFTLSGHDCLRPELYAIFYNGPHTELDPTVGWAVKTSPIPNKPGMFSELKSVNYLQNALNVMDAQDAGVQQGVFVHADGTICEGPNLNVGIVTTGGLVVTPPFERCLAGCTMRRILELIPKYVAEDLLEGIYAFEQVQLHTSSVL
jgi:4-amino-4-deoxychorismate lyase